MSGLFSACCPECGEELHIHGSGNGTCTNCGHAYLNRLGYLIPVDGPIDTDVADVADVADIDADRVSGDTTDSTGARAGALL